MLTVRHGTVHKISKKQPMSNLLTGSLTGTSSLGRMLVSLTTGKKTFKSRVNFFEGAFKWSQIKCCLSITGNKINFSLVIAFAGNIAPFEMLQRWRTVDNTVSDLTGPKFELQTSSSRDERATVRRFI